MSRLLKVLILAAAILTLSVMLVSCSNSANLAQARFVNAISDASALDIEFNGTKEFSDVAFFGYLPASGYTGVPSGSDTIKGFAAGSTTNQAFSDNVTLTAGTQYTLVATGLLTGTVVILNPT